MYSKNGKIILEPENIPCQRIILVPDKDGGISGCFRPACRIELSLGIKMEGKCDQSCDGYWAEPIMECKKHGQYVASHGCLLCDAEEAKKK